MLDRRRHAGRGMKLKEIAGKLQAQIPALFLALKDKGTPPAAKLAAGLAVAYALSPVDLIPDFIPVLGYLDDLLILPALIALAVRLIPGDVWRRCLDASAELRAEGLRGKWYFAVPVFLIWFLIVRAVLKAVL